MPFVDLIRSFCLPCRAITACDRKSQQRLSIMLTDDPNLHSSDSCPTRQHITHTTHRQDDPFTVSFTREAHERGADRGSRAHARRCRRLRSRPRTERARGESRGIGTGAPPLWRPPSCGARDDAPSITRHTQAEGKPSAIFVPSSALLVASSTPPSFGHPRCPRDAESPRAPPAESATSVTSVIPDTFPSRAGCSPRGASSETVLVQGRR
jgi:hypothetical protein